MSESDKPLDSGIDLNMLAGQTEALRRARQAIDAIGRVEGESEDRPVRVWVTPCPAPSWTSNQPRTPAIRSQAGSAAAVVEAEQPVSHNAGLHVTEDCTA
ncbi:hypothetical protein LTT02_19245 [Mycolicibacterium smegmatis]|uniref:hypothetical protein n=1 Tax=Mycolicibacterium smegmatis TaxID=1772 RepID=UPI0012FF974F|nr:hypothetical protein [Mycolicibacterium smegmatis]MCP2625623.1 hypothetical protein [Mycolicibacterium smegmatis]MCP2626392.1 hypothetical protein [Mycolicibacterium smegmatis]MDF1897757.1 hypothetical protein [Mycolicibacterium smegmatis]MDF1904313.1 hypothetical protein [Mycolicibacterium smegmatis]MDF1917712.1 hypothetical protein [Mycolicibacterium smegmatis]